MKTLYEENKGSFGTKMLSQLEVIKAVIYEILAEHSNMKKAVDTAIGYAKVFDEAPAYELRKGARLWLGKSTKDNAVAFDDQGPSAKNAIENLVKDFEKEHKGAGRAAAKNVHKYLMEKAYR